MSVRSGYRGHSFSRGVNEVLTPSSYPTKSREKIFCVFPQELQLAVELNSRNRYYSQRKQAGAPSSIYKTTTLSSSYAPLTFHKDRRFTVIMHVTIGPS